MPIALNILAQRNGAGWSDLLYLLIFLVFPALNGLGTWIRKKWGAEQETETDESTTYDVAIGEDGETILTPTRQSRRREPAPKPARPAAPARMAEIRSTTPVRVPTRAPKPAPPPRQTPQPARAHPAASHKRRKARPARAAKADPHCAFDADHAVDAIVIDEGKSPEKSAHDLLASETFDANSLRRAIILSEILAPPLAVRSPSSTPFARPDY